MASGEFIPVNVVPHSSIGYQTSSEEDSDSTPTKQHLRRPFAKGKKRENDSCSSSDSPEYKRILAASPETSRSNDSGTVGGVNTPRNLTGRDFHRSVSTPVQSDSLQTSIHSFIDNNISGVEVPGPSNREAHRYRSEGSSTPLHCEILQRRLDTDLQDSLL